MKNTSFAVLVGLAVIVGAAIFIRQFGSRQSSPPRLEENVSESTPSEESEMEGQAGGPTKATSLVSGIQLTVTAPSGNVTVSSSSLTVRGKTMAGAEVFVNDLETKADASGNFSVTLTLDEGENYILVVTNDSSGNYAEKELTVTYTP